MSQGFRARMDPTQVVRRPRNPVLQDQQRQGAILKPSYEWQQWDELTIKLRGLAPHETTYNLWTTFRDYGTISFIEIFEGNGGNRDGGAKIRFSPPPEIPIWKNSPHNIKSEGNAGETYMVQLTLLDDRRQSRTVQSPIRHTKFYPPKMKMVPSAIHFGLMVNPWSMMPLHTHIPTSSAHNDTTLVVDLKKHRLVASFTVKFENPGHNPSYDRINQYQFHIPFSQLTKIKKLELNDAAFALIISVESPPMYYRKRESKEAGHSRENLMWSEWDTWYRQTDIVYDPYVLQKETITLHKDQPVIDIGMLDPPFYEICLQVRSLDNISLRVRPCQQYGRSIRRDQAGAPGLQRRDRARSKID
ncbi:hypothetical protein WAI453_007552 [Rhynchosporium graminicola]